MADTFSGKLHIWDGWRSAAVATAASGPALYEGPTDLERIKSLFLQETFLKKTRRKETTEPLSLGWFVEIEGVRHGRYGRWLARQLEFGKHRGEKLLGMGPGLGTDWVQYALQGAEVVACSSSADQLALVKRNFDLRGLTARFIHADPTVLPLETASIDVACVTSFLEGQPSPAAVVQEMYRVLKPGGKVLALVPAAYNVAFWCRNWLPWRRKKQVQSQFTGFTGRGLRLLFDRFVEPRICKRQLRRSDVPHLLRWFPPSILERVMGRFLILRAFKPLHASLAVPVAA